MWIPDFLIEYQMKPVDPPYQIGDWLFRTDPNVPETRVVVTVVHDNGAVVERDGQGFFLPLERLLTDWRPLPLIYDRLGLDEMIEAV